LRELGDIDGQSVKIEYREANGDPERLVAAAADLVGLPVDVIATAGTPAARAAQLATAVIRLLPYRLAIP
jgi:putative ABC transport system substrate-binding protein